MSYKQNRSLGHIELTEKQSEFHKVMRNPKTRVVFISGPAGTAKTFLSIYTALYKHYDDNLLNILYLRSLAESADKGMGFLKGTMDDKFGPYVGPLEDKLQELLSPAEKKHIEMKHVNIISCMDGERRNALHRASLEGHSLIVKLLLDTIKTDPMYSLKQNKITTFVNKTDVC